MRHARSCMPLTITARAVLPLSKPACLVAIALLLRVGDVRAQPAPVPAEDPFARRGWHLDFGGQGALEAWNYNGSHEELGLVATGFTYGLRDGLVLTASWPLFYVSQRGVDAGMMGATFGVRGRIVRGPRWSIFLSGAVGVSDADTFVPPRGTRFNYLAIGGFGVTMRLHRGIHGLAGLDLIHISNGGFAGRDRNPDIEAIGPRVGVLLAF